MPEINALTKRRVSFGSHFWAFQSLVGWSLLWDLWWDSLLWQGTQRKLLISWHSGSKKKERRGEEVPIFPAGVRRSQYSLQGPAHNFLQLVPSPFFCSVCVCCLFLFLFLFWATVLICSSAKHWSYFIAKVGLHSQQSSASASRVLGLQASTTMPHTTTPS